MSKFGIIPPNNVFIRSMKKNGNRSHWILTETGSIYSLLVRSLILEIQPFLVLFLGSDCTINCYDFETKQLIRKLQASYVFN